MRRLIDLSYKRSRTLSYLVYVYLCNGCIICAFVWYTSYNILLVASLETSTSPIICLVYFPFAPVASLKTPCPSSDCTLYSVRHPVKSSKSYFCSVTTLFPVTINSLKKKNCLFHTSESNNNNNLSCVTTKNDSIRVTKKTTYSSLPSLYSSILPKNRSHLVLVSSSFPVEFHAQKTTCVNL